MRVLLDTCALLELRDPRGNPAVKTTVALIPDDELYLSALILGEVAKGIALLPDGRKRRALISWLTALESQFADRVLPVDHATGHLWGDISARVQRAGLMLSAVEGLVAATALQHGLHVMTRTTTHFAATGALIVDPWKESEKNDDAE
jgi:predicted nucleic acid-binding protein